jgi:multiple inositol-polyphosphate phosphatase/2,3-bisphosphoglycerate 3-phosphatase
MTPTAALLVSLLSNKTPYLNSSFVTNPSPPTPVPDACNPVPVSIEGVLRHGARHTDHIDEMNDLAASLAAESRTLSWPSSYTYPAPSIYANQLLEMGMNEHNAIGSKLASLYPSLFSSYSPVTMGMNSTTLPRTGQSATSFCSGASIASPFIALDSGVDEKLRFFDFCPIYDANKDSAVAVADDYKASDEALEAVEEFNELAGVPRGTYSYEDMNLSFEACAYDVIFSNDVAKFCSLLSPNAITVLNYAIDVSKYYAYGPGTTINRNFTAVLIADVIHSIDKSLGSDYKGTLRFAHAETLIPFISALGMFDNQPALTVKRDDNRSFKMNEIAPFAGNVVLTVHKCDEEKVVVKGEINGKEFIMRGCEGEVYCDYKHFQEGLNDLIEMSNGGLTEICSVD